MSEKKILSVKVKREVDTDPDTSWIGEYTDELKPGNIIVSTGEYVEDTPEDEWPEKGREYRCFKPEAGGEKVGTEDYKKYGKQDFEYMKRLNNGDACFYGITAVAKVKAGGYLTQTIRSGGLWGIESDAPEYHKEVAQEQLAELQKELTALGFGTMPKWDGEFSE